MVWELRSARMKFGLTLCHLCFGADITDFSAVGDLAGCNRICIKIRHQLSTILVVSSNKTFMLAALDQFC